MKLTDPAIQTAEAFMDTEGARTGTSHDSPVVGDGGGESGNDLAQSESGRDQDETYMFGDIHVFVD